MSKGSISLVRANPALTTNVKLVVDTQYNLYLESYSSNPELSDKRFKKFLINHNSFLSQRIASFYKDIPTDIAFEVRNLTQSDAIQINYDLQYDDLYYSGPRNVEDTRYLEEFQYNTSLKICPSNLPKYFFIFRVDGPGVDAIRNLDNLTGSNVDNIKTDYFQKFKVCSVFDLTPKTNLGKLWKKNYIDDDVIPVSPLEFVLKKFEFSKWKGYDYYTGGSVEKSFMLDDFMANQTTHFEFEKFITEGFKKNAVICSNIANVSFLFDDTSAGVFYQQAGIATDIHYYEHDYPFITDWIRQGKIKSSQYNRVYDSIVNSSYYTFNEHVPYRKKWTINRYSGFYVDNIEFIDQVSPYVTVAFNIGAGIQIVNNKFEDGSGNPMSPIKGVWNVNLPIYLKIDNKHYLIEQQGLEYILISDTIINGSLDTLVTAAQKSIRIVYENVKFNPSLGVQVDVPIYRSTLKFVDDTYYTDIDITNYLSNSVVVVKISDKFYALKQDTKLGVKYYYLDTDEYIVCDSELLTRKLGFNDSENLSMQVLNKDTQIPYFEIYVLQFTTVADFDFQRTDTKYSLIENDKSNEVSYERSFIHLLDVKDTSAPIDLYYEQYYNIWLDSAAINTTPSYSQLFNGSQPYLLPLNSEYGTGDLYMFGSNGKLTKIWDVNQSVVKWGLHKSINNVSYPYKMNNSLDVSGLFNFTPSIYEAVPNIRSMNLDYFYTRGSITQNVINRSVLIDTVEIFDTVYYKDSNAKFDIFDYYFNIPSHYSYTVGVSAKERIYEYPRISYFSQSDLVNGPMVFHKGLAAYIQYVDTDNPNYNSSYKYSPADDLQDYGFSILFNSRYTSNTALYGKAGIDIVLNKIYKNLLINIYMYTDGSYTCLDHANRDSIYSMTNLNFNTGQFDTTSTPTGQIVSELTTKGITLKNLVDILNKTKLTHPEFSQGIQYTIVDTVKEYTLSSIAVTVTTGKSRIQFTSTEDVDFKEGDWIYLTNTGQANLNNKNVQIIEKINNRVFVFYEQGDYVTNVISPLTIFTKEKSVLPFRLKVIDPDVVKINSKVNLVTGDVSCPVTPNNKFSIDKDIVININNEGVVPYVYVNDVISRRIENHPEQEIISYSDLAKLPTILRYSGHYDAIVNNITLFKQTTLINYNTQILTRAPFFVESVLNNGYYYLIIHMREVGTTLADRIAVGNIFQVLFSNIPLFQYASGDVIKVEPSIYFNLVTPGTTGYKITLSTKFLTNPLTGIVYTANPALSAPGVIDYGYNAFTAFGVKLFTKINKNIEFAFDYADFATSKNLIISKVYEGVNPLKTNNEVFKTTNKYPMIDEHGVTEVNRNLFKGSWDPEFYYKTVNNKYKLKS
jgi:hypothetical protein